MHSGLLLTLKEDGYTLRIELNEQQRLSVTHNFVKPSLILDSDQVFYIKNALETARLSYSATNNLSVTRDNIFAMINGWNDGRGLQKEHIKICFPLTALQRQIFIHMCEQHLGTFQYYD